jgi:hypothetical protein
LGSPGGAVKYTSPEHSSPQPGGSGAGGPEPRVRSVLGSRSSGGGRHHAGRRSKKAAGMGQPAKAGQIADTGQVRAGEVVATGQVAAAGQVASAGRVASAGPMAATAGAADPGRAADPQWRRERAEGTAEQAAPIRFAQLPYVAVLIGMAIALAIVGQGVHMVKSGTLVFAGVLLMAALARLVLPERRAGMLSSRRRLLDVAIFGVLGIGLLVGALVVPVPG